MKPTTETDPLSLDKKATRAAWIIRGTICLVILLIANGAAQSLRNQKKEPSKASPQAESLTVELQTVAFTDVSIELEATGVAKALRYIDIAAEIPGNAVMVAQDLKAGARVKKGDLLFVIDSGDYEAARAEAQAQVAQLKSTIKRLGTQQKADKTRQGLLKRNRDLAQAERERVERLFKQDKIGSASSVERAEQAANQAETQLVMVEQALSIYPAQIQEVTSQQQAAQARLKRAELNLSRCRVHAPSDARVTMADLEKGEYLTPGRTVLSLADDRTLEIQASIDSTDLRKWLQFKEEEVSGNWFPPVEPVNVAVEWTEGSESIEWQGQLHRIVSFDASTRTAKLAVRVEASDEHDFPLVDGMFCRLRIPGRNLASVTRLPRASVTFDQHVYLSVDGKLRTAKVSVLRNQGEYVLVDGGLEEGQQVITTRLVSPLEGVNIKTPGN